MKYWKLLLLFGTCFQCVHCIEIRSLAKDKWKLENSDKKIVNDRVTIPSGIFTDLSEAGILNESIYYRFNDVKYRKFAKKNWTYSLNFSVQKDLSFNDAKELIFHGLDGHVRISLNNHFLGNATNSFIRYRFDVTQLLTSENRLQLAFESPVESGKRLAHEAPHRVPPDCVPTDYNGECHVNFLRRMQASFGWDWGLAVPSVGIWKPVDLVFYQNDLLVRDITFSAVRQSGKWKVDLVAFCEGPLRSIKDITGRIEFVLFVKSNETIRSSTDVTLSSHSISRVISVAVTIFVPQDSVDMWWPNGYGNQNLYRLVTSFTNGVNENSKTVMVGFRMAKLVQEFVNTAKPDQGLTFYFSINDVAVFAKGTNYIPSNILLEKSANKKTIRYLLESAKRANMNMIRVWGGGIYESDYFYELCDELGLLIWQDMMFACNMYPADELFLSLVRLEVSQQIKRLQHHASIVIWAGNNENEAALSGNWYGTSSNYSLFKEEYVELYVHVVREVIRSIDRTRSYIVSSPTNGLKSDAEGYVSSSPYSSLYGDVHFYDYFHNSWLIDHYPMTRFSSEYGFQSLPSLSSLQKVATEKDLSTLYTPFMRHRQHLPLGHLYLVYLMFFHFAAPALDDLDNLIYTSQINQAWSVKSQTEWYRKWRGRLLPTGEGRTMGAMYWQLNDVWQAPSWSSIEFDGKWKMLHYYAAHFFLPVIVTADLNYKGIITINVISDLLEDLKDTNVKLEIYKWSSMEPVETSSKIVTVKKESSICLFNTNVTELIDSNPSCQPENFNTGSKCFLKLILKDTQGQILHENHLFPVSFKSIAGLQNCDIVTTVKICRKPTECDILLETNTICLFVWLNAGDLAGYFSDNGIIMTQPTKVIQFYSDEEVTVNQLQNSLTVSVLDQRRLDKFSFAQNVASAVQIMIEDSSKMVT